MVDNFLGEKKTGAKEDGQQPEEDLELSAEVQQYKELIESDLDTLAGFTPSKNGTNE